MERKQRPVKPETLVPGLNAAIRLLRQQAKTDRDAASNAHKAGDGSHGRALEFAAHSFEAAADYIFEEKERLTKPQPPEVDPRQIPLFDRQ